MNEFRHAALLKEKLEGLHLSARFRQIALTFAEVPYGWGLESLNTTDCSGVISGTLQFLGYNVRTTAHRFYTTVFEDCSNTFKDEDVHAAFFLDDDGIARHVALMVSPTVAFHASGARGATFDTILDLQDEYANKDETLVIQKLNWDKMEVLEGEAYGLDKDYL